MDSKRIENNPILSLSLKFAIQIIAFHEELVTAKKFVVANQLVRSGTSIGANAFEAQQAESRADFIHKMKIAAKEAAETEFWILVCQHAPGYHVPPEITDLLSQINRILNAILKTSNVSRSRS